jgi:spermidine synthase
MGHGGGRRIGPAAPVVLAVLVLLMVYLATARGTTIFEGESAFGRIRVTERSDGLRALYTGDGRARQSASYPLRPRHLELEYTRVAMIGLALAPAYGRLLFVGLGGGSMPRYAHHVLDDVTIDVVEIDAAIVDVAHRHFAFVEDERMTVHTADGRAFIEAAERSWDVIFLDAFSDTGIPHALTTIEFLQAVKDALPPDGVVVSNLWSSNEAYASMVATYAAVFDEVHLIRVGSRDQRILVAGTGARPLDRTKLTAAARSLSARTELGFDLVQMVESGYEVYRAAGARVLRDDD